LGISQEKLAARAGLRRTYLSDVERGARNISLLIIQRLATALQVPASALLAFPRETGETAPAAQLLPADDLAEILLVEERMSEVEQALQALKQANIANPIRVAHDGPAALDCLLRPGRNCAPEQPGASAPSPPHTCGGEGRGEEASTGLMTRASFHRTLAVSKCAAPNPPPQLILLDLDLPKMDGLEVLRRIKADPRTRSIPVIILAASNQDKRLPAANQLGAATHILKPVVFQNLLEAALRLPLQWALLRPEGSSLP
jgi:CheY-like chemotaxis protein/DNA-binding XRE family transcriptional regulator